MSANNINFIEIDPKKDIEDLIQKFEKDTGSKVYNAQDTRILIQLMAYYANLVKCQFNEAAKLNLVELSRYPILDFLGKYKNCERLENEDDKSYIRRILLAPEGFSVAGPEAAYVYHALSADSSIIDIAINVPNDDITVDCNGTTLTIADNEAENSAIRVNANYLTGEVNLTLKQNLPINTSIKVNVPHPFKLDMYVLTETLPCSDEVFNKIAQKLTGKIPLLDRVELHSALSEDFNIAGKVIINKNADIYEVEDNINAALNDYLTELKKSLKRAVIIKQIENKIMGIEGVQDCSILSPAANLPAKCDTVYFGTVTNLEYERGV